MARDLFGNSAKNEIVVNQRSAALSNLTYEDIERLGDESAMKLSNVSTSLMAQVKSSDIQEFGSGLNQLIGVAKGLDPTKFGKPGLLGKITGFFGNAKEKMMSEYQTVEQRMNVLVKELDKTSDLQKQRVSDLEQMFLTNVDTGRGIVAAKDKANDMRLFLEDKLKRVESEGDFQIISDTRDQLSAVDKKIGDLSAAESLCIMAGPQIRLLQASSRTLSEKFKNVKAITIPALTQAYSLYIIQQEQANATKLAEGVNELTNNALKAQADSLRQNSKDIARVGQQAIIETATLKHMHNQLLGTLDDVMKEVEAGTKQRKESAKELDSMKLELFNKFKK